MPDAATAVDHAARRIGGVGATGWREALIGVADGEEADGDGADDAAPEQLAQGDTGGAAFDENAITDADRDDASEGADLLFRRYRENLRPREGGKANDPDDRGGPTNKGISQEYWISARNKEVYKDFPRATHDLTDDQIEEILRRDFFEEPKVDKLAQVPGLDERAPKLAEQVFDTAVLHGAPTAGRILQQALDEVVGSDLKEPHPKNTGQTAYDGDIGPKTRGAVAQAIKDGKIDEVNNRMVELRIEAMGKAPTFADHKGGWIPRAESFRIPMK